MRFVLRRAYLDPKNVEMAFFMGVLQLCYLIWGFRSGFDTHTRTKEARLDESKMLPRPKKMAFRKMCKGSA